MSFLQDIQNFFSGWSGNPQDIINMIKNEINKDIVDAENSLSGYINDSVNGYKNTIKNANDTALTIFNGNLSSSSSSKLDFFAQNVNQS